MDRTHPLTTAPVNRFLRWSLQAAAGLVGAALGGVIALLAGVLLQPSFTELEQSALRLVPDGWDAQPPVELVEPLGAFDRAYRVEVRADDLGIAAVRDRARRLGWTVTERDGVLELQRDGVRANVALDRESGAVTTSIDPGVRRDQRRGAVVGVAVGAAAGWWWLVRRWRRHPRIRVVTRGSAVT